MRTGPKPHFDEDRSPKSPVVLKLFASFASFYYKVLIE